MNRILLSLLSAPLLFSITSAAIGEDLKAQAKPRVLVILWGQDHARIVKEGVSSHSDFRRLFLDSYGIEGERFHPPENSPPIGLLIASDMAKTVSVPIWTWKAADGTSLFLCQGSDDGSPPEFSVFSHSEKDLLSQIEKFLDVEKK